MEIRNGTTVHQVWGDLEDAELLMVTQYPNHAATFCEAAILTMPDNVRLVMVNHYDGAMRIFSKPEAAA